MSFEGYCQHLCPNGHYWEDDVYICDSEEGRCGVCGEKYVWHNVCDQTNGDDPKTGKGYGHVDLKVLEEVEYDECPTCGHKKKTKEKCTRSPKNVSVGDKNLIGFLKAQDKAELKVAAFELLRIQAHGYTSPVTNYILGEVLNMVEEIREPKKAETRGRPKK